MGAQRRNSSAKAPAHHPKKRLFFINHFSRRRAAAPRRSRLMSHTSMNHASQINESYLTLKRGRVLHSARSKLQFQGFVASGVKFSVSIFCGSTEKTTQQVDFQISLPLLSYTNPREDWRLPSLILLRKSINYMGPKKNPQGHKQPCLAIQFRLCTAVSAHMPCHRAPGIFCRK